MNSFEEINVMSSFAPRVAGSTVGRPDPSKHVNYTLGMVLGVDDFTQEFAYLTGRDQWLARDLVGYGTASGLRVTVEHTPDRAEVVVAPGSAVGPAGQLIRVTPTQCADLNEWLGQERNRERLSQKLKTATSLTLYVVLGYRECATDDVPIPGEPCRSEEESMAASRLADNFRLELRFDPPDQREEAALRDFVQWLSQIEVVEDVAQEVQTSHEISFVESYVQARSAGEEVYAAGGAFVTPGQFEAEIRRAARLSPGDGPTSPPDFMYDSPPASMRMRASEACDLLRRAFRIWVTELRPLWLGAGQTAGGSPPAEEGVLLAELTVPVVKAETGARWFVDHPEVRRVESNEDARPFLLHLRLIQEWVECGRRERAPSDSVVPETAFGQPSHSGASEAYSRADHTHGTPDITGDVTLDGDGDTVVGRINGLAVLPNPENPPDDGDVLTFSQGGWVAADAQPLAMFGDVTGATDNNTLTRMQGVRLAFDDAAAAEGQLLTYTVDEGEGSWTNADLRLQGARVRPPGGDASPPTSPPGALTDGHVLTYRESEAGEGLWGAEAIPETVLEGDVTGQASATTVLKIRGTDVADLSKAALANGQLLTFFASEEPRVREWRAMAPPPLVGDVIGAPAATTVVRLRGTDVANFSEAANAPADGQVLRFVKGGADAGRWEAADLPEPPAPALALTGDVEGSTGEGGTTVRRIQGRAVADFSTTALAPQNGNVLTYVAEGEAPPLWRARTPQLAGNVTGPIDSTMVRAIHNVNVLTRNGPAVYNNGDVLVYRDNAWTPEPLPAAPPSGTTSANEGSSVLRPAGLPAYSIVAAGIVRGDGTSRSPTYNNLLVRGTGAGTVTITFDGYVGPTGTTFQYVVKAMAVAQTAKESPLFGVSVNVMFDRFNAGAGLGFILRVTANGQELAADLIRTLEFMVEVSRYEVVAPK